MSELITGTAFIPEIGKCYEVHFGKLPIGAEGKFVSARVKINGSLPKDWQDIDTGKQLDPLISKYVVQAFKEIDCAR